MQRKRLIVLVIALLLAGTISVLPSAAQEGDGEGELLAVLEAYMDAFAGDVETLPQFLTEDVVRHHLRGPNMDVGELAEQFGIDELTENAMGFQAGFPGVEFLINHSVERDDYIWISGSTTELPDTDGQVINYVLVARYSDGKIAEVWVAGDELAMWSLLDALPATEE